MKATLFIKESETPGESGILCAQISGNATAYIDLHLTGICFSRDALGALNRGTAINVDLEPRVWAGAIRAELAEYAAKFERTLEESDYLTDP